MSGASNPAIRSTNHALVVAHPSTRGPAAAALQQLGFTCDFADDPYAATLVLARGPAAYRAVILGLAGLFKEELGFIEVVKRRFGTAEVWLTQTDGRQATLVEAMRLGADALLGEEGLYRLSTSSVSARFDPLLPPHVSPPPTSVFSSSSSTAATLVQAATDPAAPPREGDPSDDSLSNDMLLDEPVLTADELRALLHEQPNGLSGGYE